jgi:signal transduction histidine kinase
MGTDQAGRQALLAALELPDWSSLLKAVSLADAWARTAIIGDPMLDKVAVKLAELASHPKWEIRRAVANVAAHVAHPAFDPTLVVLALDDNGRVRQAARQAALRRRDSRNASALGKQHAERINATLDDIESRFGLRGREAVRRAAEQIADTFARELYHEVIRLLSPLATSAERLRGHLSASERSHDAMREEADRIDRRVEHLGAVLGGMRVYTEQPTLRFTSEDLREIVMEAAALARRGGKGKPDPIVDVRVPDDVIVEIARPRLVQALTNVLENAIDSYDGVEVLKPVVVSVERQEGRIAIVVEDSGCGMSAEAQADAVKLFATNKPNGTGFGLPLVVKIVESEHGGRVELNSQRGRGTIVRLTIRTHR